MTKQVDVDIYYDDGTKMDVSGMKVNIEIITPRMREKGPEYVTIARA